MFPFLEEFSTQFAGIHTVKGFGIVNKAEADKKEVVKKATLLLFL